MSTSSVTRGRSDWTSSAFRDMAEHTYLERVHQDLEGGVQSDVHGTPTLFINGERYKGRAQAADLYRALLRRLEGEPGAHPFYVDEVNEASAELGGT